MEDVRTFTSDNNRKIRLEVAQGTADLFNKWHYALREYRIYRDPVIFHYHVRLGIRTPEFCYVFFSGRATYKDGISFVNMNT